MIRRLAVVWGTLSTLLLGSGCGLNMQRHYGRLRPALLARDFDAAAATVAAAETTVYGGGSRLLFLLDRGTLLQLGGHYVASNEAFSAAALLAQDLWTEQVSAHAAAWLTTDNALPYAGEDVEHVHVHLLSALNYLALGQLEDARVETRRASHILALLATRGEDPNAHYRDDGFARWLAGRLAEASAPYDADALGEAWIDYRRALMLYAGTYGARYGVGVPARLVADAARVLARLGHDFADERTALIAQYPAAATPAALPVGWGRVVLLHLGGEAPIKVDQKWVVPVGRDLVSVAHPAFVRRDAQVAGAWLVAADGTRVPAERMEDLATVAIETLADRVAAVRGRAIARATARWAATHAARSAGEARHDAAGDALAAAASLLQFGQAVADEADKRSWATLPATVSVAEMALPAGPQALTLEFVDAAGRTVERAAVAARVPAGADVFLSYRTFR